MGAYSALLESMQPESGRMIKEDGTLLNRADAYTIDGGGNLSLRVTADLTVGDIEIGAVEIKDHDSTARLDIVTDDDAMPATPNFMPVGGEYRATLITYADGDATVLQADVNGKLFTAGIYAEDVAHVDADWGMHILTVRDDAPVAKAGADGDYQSLTTDDTGALWQRSRAFDTSSDSDKGFEVAPIWNQHIEETLADVTNETDATNEYFIDMDGYQYLTIEVNTGGTAPTSTITITVEAGNQDDGTAAASIFYTDVTQAWFGVASAVDTDIRWERDTPIDAKFVKIKTVTAGGGNDQDYTIYIKKHY